MFGFVIAKLEMVNVTPRHDYDSNLIMILIQILDLRPPTLVLCYTGFGICILHLNCIIRLVRLFHMYGYDALLNMFVKTHAWACPILVVDILSLILCDSPLILHVLDSPSDSSPSPLACKRVYHSGEPNPVCVGLLLLSMLIMYFWKTRYKWKS